MLRKDASPQRLRKDASPQRRKERKGGAEMGSNPLRRLCVLCVPAVKRPPTLCAPFAFFASLR